MKPIIPLLSLVLLLASAMPLRAQGNKQEPQQPQKFVALVEEAPKLTFFQGFTLSADVFGVAQRIFSDYATFEGALRLNLKNTFFPIVELGFATCDSEDANTFIRYKTNAPYLRVGVDFNMLKDKFQDNRLFLGARYGLSRYNFDISGPPIKDPVWGGSEPFSYTDIATTSHWLEIVVGVQVKVWRNFHMGWSVRYKREISSTKNQYAKPYYIPGFGTTTQTTAWGASYNLIFDLNWGKTKRTVRQVTLTHRPLQQPTDTTSVTPSDSTLQQPQQP